MNKKLLNLLVLPVVLCGLVACGGESSSDSGSLPEGSISTPGSNSSAGTVVGKKYSFVNDAGTCGLRDKMPVIQEKGGVAGAGSAVGPGDLVLDGATFVLSEKTYCDNKSYDETTYPGLKVGASKTSIGMVSSKTAEALKSVSIEASGYGAGEKLESSLVLQTSTDGLTFTTKETKVLTEASASYTFTLDASAVFFRFTAEIIAPATSARFYIQSITLDI